MTHTADRFPPTPVTTVRSARRPLVRRLEAVSLVGAFTLVAACASAHAQTAAATTAAPAERGESTMVQLIRGLIKSGALAKDVGEALLAQAQTEAMAAQQAQRKAAAGATAVAGAGVAGSAAGAGSSAVAAATGGAVATRTAGGDVRVTYVPETVKDQIRQELRGEVMAQAKAEGWAAPSQVPEWTRRIRIEGDVRVRNESRLYGGNNSNQEVNFAAINAGSPYDVNPNTTASLPPLLNTRQDRSNQWRARARLGVVAALSEATQAGIRVATGSDANPVSTTQTLGGGLEKKSIWLDQAWMSHSPVAGLTITGGRFGNPFVTTDMLFSSDLNLDGVAGTFKRAFERSGNLEVFGTVGLIPLEYLSSDFPKTSQDKTASKNKWLLGLQAGATWKVDAANQLRGTLAYYDFHHISGERSTPCALYAGEDHCSTDWSRPAFMQRGNSIMSLRDVALNPQDPANTAMPQYFGLASRFRLADVNLRWDTRVASSYGLRLDVNLLRNMAYDADEMFTRSGGNILNNFDGSGGTGRAAFRSGGNAYQMMATFGALAPEWRGDWNVFTGYKRIEPDALPDGYNDSTFHGGGTNARGFIVGGAYAFDRNAWVTGRWISSKEVYGPPVSIDTLQIDFNARF
ncbi:putative porin [Roseateles amylovorans]|uniref:Porin n=1 Tax=Roseateles amylovorans TaxID=2978473 RepID=A0ABY6AYQ4_9BURK|nr:putative porin [Roseateles amylovorans]UXH77413.1 putative porin [Roseateles amylovorans]